MTAPSSVPSARFAFQRVYPRSPVLRVRYRQGVVIGPYGFPEWTPWARALVELPAPLSRLGIDEERILGVLIGNALLAETQHPLSTGPGEPHELRTPAGWVWAYQAMSRRMALVPADLYLAFRHLGGISTLHTNRNRRGVTGMDGERVAFGFAETLAEESIEPFEQALGAPLPVAYRQFLRRTNGARPLRPAVHPAFGFVADQPFFGLGRSDRAADLGYLNSWLSDRLTSEFLAIGQVQGGLLAVCLHGADAGSVWYLDDDDPRDDDGYDAAEIRARLLHRCAADLTTFLSALRTPPSRLGRLAAAAVSGRYATLREEDGLGSALPSTKRR